MLKSFSFIYSYIWHVKAIKQSGECLLLGPEVLSKSEKAQIFAFFLSFSLSAFTTTRVCLCWVNWGCVPPQSQTLKAVLLIRGGGGLHLTIERASQWRAPVWATEQNRERGGREEGIWLGDKAAGTGCLAGSRSYCALVLPESLTHSETQRASRSADTPSTVARIPRSIWIL